MNKEKNLNRRTLLKSSFLASSGIALSQSSNQVSSAELKKPNEDTIILFQGDSITDAGRDRKNEMLANNARMLGRGYPNFIAGHTLAKWPQKRIKIYNRGISGNKVPDLAARWQKDCIDIKPNLLSVLIGVNDIWHKLNGNYDGSVKVYEEGFTKLIERTKDNLPNTAIVICEPFALKCGAVKDNWFPEFDNRREAAKRVSKKFSTIFVPFQKMFDNAIKAGTKAEYWAADGVHPSIAGHALMAKTWTEIVSKSDVAI